MLVLKQGNTLRSYFVVANYTRYMISKINLYKDDGILVSTRYQGWFENKDGEDIQSIELPVDEIKVRKEECFDGKVFVVSEGEGIITKALMATLYIPADMLDIHFVENFIDRRFGCTQLKAIYEGLNNIRIEVCVDNLDKELNNIKKQYEEVYKSCESYGILYRYEEEVLENIDKLRTLAQKYFDERNRVKRLTIDDIN